MVEELHLDSVGFMKLDIEGAEKRLWRSQEHPAEVSSRMAIAMEHLPDDPVAIPRVILAEAPSTVVCGDCVDQDPACAPTCFSSATPRRRAGRNGLSLDINFQNPVAPCYDELQPCRRACH